jgi:hypothetical protein
MKEKRDYIDDIAEIRSMMERSSRFSSLSGWAGILAGIYALAGAFIAYSVFDFNPDAIKYGTVNKGNLDPELKGVFALALIILFLSMGTAVALSGKKAKNRGEKIWNATSRRLLESMAVPLVSGGLLVLICIANDLVGLAAPLTLIFYGLALVSASKFTYVDVKYLGLIQIVLGLISACFIGWSLLLWAAGFGAAHMLYGISIHKKYERR